MNNNLELAHGLVEAAQVAVVFCRLNVEFPEGFFGQLEGGEVQIMGLLQEAFLSFLVMAINGNLLQDKCWR